MQVYYYKDEKHGIEFLAIERDGFYYWTTNYLDTVYKSERIPLSKESMRRVKLLDVAQLPTHAQKQVLYLQVAVKLNRSCDKKELERLIEKVE